MTIGRTQRLKLYTWSSGSDYFLTRLQENEMMQTLDDKVAIDMQGATIAERPAATNVPRGTFWSDLQTGATYRSTGYVWVLLGAQMASGATGGMPAALDFGAIGKVGISGTAARSDHVHAMPNLSGNVPSKVQPGVNGSAGTANQAARADHVHQFVPSAADDTGWVVCTPNSPNWVNGAGDYPIKARRVGTLVTIRGAAVYMSGTVSATSVDVVVATLPKGFAPVVRTWIAGCVSSEGQAVANFEVTPAGQITWPAGDYRQMRDAATVVVPGMYFPLTGSWYTD